MFDIGWPEMAVVAVIALIIIGPKDLPRIMRWVGGWAGKARGMARQFQRSFVLAEGIEISGANLDNGLLHIELVRPEPELVSRVINITTGPPKADGTLTLTIDDEREEG